MASYFNLLLDTLAPSGLTMTINDDALYAVSPDVVLSISVDDEDTTGYQMKIWGIDGAETEDDASWETYTTTKNVTLPGEDGLKTVSIKVRDDVGNETATVTDTITLDTVVPVVSVTGPDKSKISKVAGYDVAIINFMASVAFKAYKVCVVPATTSAQNAGALIETTYGSANTSGEKEDGEELYPADTNIEVTINGADLEGASSGDGVKIVKVFVQSEAGTWSVA